MTSAQVQDPYVAGLRFLIVEDHGFQRWTLGHYLEQLGAKTVFNAGDGQTALEMYKSADPPVDIIITDLNMPGMDGIQFVHHVADFGKPVGLVLVTAQEAVLPSVEAMTREYGVNLLAAIKKPVTAEILRTAIARYRWPPERGSGKDSTPGSRLPLERIVEGLDNDELEPFFQPEVELSSRAIRSAQVLPRWRHPSDGIVALEEFLPALEASGHADRLATEMLRKALPTCKSWRIAGIGATVSVPLSLSLLADVTLVDRLMETVRESQVDPRHVVFEVGEPPATGDLGKALENLSRFRLYGFGLSLDGHVPGPSSAAELARFPFTEVKVDLSSVRGGGKVLRRAVLEAALATAKALRGTAIADGVESAEEMVVLRDVGYEVVQGPFVASPMKASDFLRWSVDSKARAAAR